MFIITFSAGMKNKNSKWYMPPKDYMYFIQKLIPQGYSITCQPHGEISNCHVFISFKKVRIGKSLCNVSASIRRQIQF